MCYDAPQPAPYVDAVLRGDEAAVRSWLEGGGRVNATREIWYKSGVVISGATLLMDAAKNGHERVVEMLLQRGADVNLQNIVGVTALMLAVR